MSSSQSTYQKVFFMDEDDEKEQLSYFKKLPTVKKYFQKKVWSFPDLLKFIQYYVGIKIPQKYYPILKPLQVCEEKKRVIENYEQKSNEWLISREKRATTSNWAAMMGINPYSDKKKTLTQLLWRKFKGNSATRYGSEMEDVAQNVFERHRKKSFSNFCIVNTGLQVSTQIGFLGGSPDGLLYEQGQQNSKEIILLEIKCPFRGRLYGKIPVYYYPQIQGTMGLHNYSSCDFVVFTEKKTQIQRYNFHEHFYYCNMLPKVLKFYLKEYLPRVYLQMNGRLEEGEINPIEEIYLSIPDKNNSSIIKTTDSIDNVK